MNIKDLLRFGRSTRAFSIDERYKELQEANVERDPNNIHVKSITPKIAGGGTDFETAEVDLVQIGQAYYTDAYISRAVNKIVGLMFKSGWGFSSNNKDALAYIEKRFRLMEESTHKKTRELLRELGLNFVLYSNAIVVKTRGQENLADVDATGYYGGEPISALFVGNPEQFQVQRDDFGNIENYQLGDNTSAVQFAPEDIEHMTYQKPTGRAYGVPYITNSLRDVLILRQIEQTVTNILYRNLHPLQTYTVGLAEAGMEAQPGEIEEVQAAIEGASLDSIFVIPERHKLQNVSSGSDFTDATGYLKYFRQRVFTGLGVSESTMGIGDSSNRSTSDNQSSDLIDLVKDFQQNFTPGFQKIVDELLFEGGYDPTLNEEDRVEFMFTEIEQGAKIARENHEMQKYLMHIQSLDEARQAMGYEPIEDLSRFHGNLFNGTTTDDNGTIDNRDRPENQHGKADAPPKDSLKDAVSTGRPLDFFETKKDSSQMLTESQEAVMLHADNDKNRSIELANAWEMIVNELKDDFYPAKEKLVSLFDAYLDDTLFLNSPQKQNFIELVSTQLHAITEQDSSQSNYLYHYDKNIIASYINYMQLLEERSN